MSLIDSPQNHQLTAKFRHKIWYTPIVGEGNKKYNPLPQKGQNDEEEQHEHAG